MKTKAEILERIDEIEEKMRRDWKMPITEYKEHLGRLKALNWVLNKD